MGAGAVAAAPLITGLAGAAATGIGAALEPGTPGPLRAQVPPELEIKQLDIINSQINDFNTERQRNLAIADSLTERASIIDQFSSGIIPKQEAIQKINKQNQQITTTFGDEILKLVSDKSGGAEKSLGLQIRDEASRLLSGPLDQFKDPKVESQIEEGRAQLRERLNRQYGPGFADTEAGRRAFRDFELGANDLRVNTGRERVARLGQVTQSVGTFGEFLRGQRDSAANQLSQATQLGFAGANLGKDLGLAAQEVGIKNLQAGQIPFQTINTFGTQVLSQDIKDTLKNKQPLNGGGTPQSEIERARELLKDPNYMVLNGRVVPRNQAGAAYGGGQQGPRLR